MQSRLTLSTLVFLLLAVLASEVLASPPVWHVRGPLFEVTPGSDGTRSARPAGPDRPRSLAAADLSTDGAPELLVGFAIAGGGRIDVYPGNPDAVFPYGPEAVERRLAGSLSTRPFLGDPSFVELPAAPDFLDVGDVDGDGVEDVVWASERLSAFFWLPGDGEGGVGGLGRVELPAPPTALLVGDLDLVSGPPDVIVAVGDSPGAQLMRFPSALGGPGTTPSEVHELPARATALVARELTGDAYGDLAVAAGSEVIVFHGSSPFDPDAAGRTSIPLPSPAVALAAGDLDSDGRRDLAVAAPSGEVRILWRSDAEEMELPWTVGEVHPVETTAGEPPRLLVSRTSGAPGHDLLLLRRAVAGGPGPHFLPPDSPQGAFRGPVVLELPSRPVAALSMHQSLDALQDLVTLDAQSGEPLVTTTLASQVFEVNSPADTDDGACDLPSTGDCTLREAILAANAHAGADEIRFAIPPFGTVTIQPATDLPLVTDPVTLDGFTQDPFSGTPPVEVDGSLATNHGLQIQTDSSLVTGFVFNRAPSSGLFLDGGTGHRIEHNFAGTDSTGTAAQGNRFGLVISGNAHTIGGTLAAQGNLVSGNLDSGAGIFIFGSMDLTILNNLIGTDSAGTQALGNGLGIWMLGDTRARIGTPINDVGNVISGNNTGIFMSEFTTGDTVEANFIGTDRSGTATLGNSLGIHLGGATQERIGETSETSGNVISGNETGIDIASTSGNNQVLGNFIGLDKFGRTVLGNTNEGILISASGTNFVGGLVVGSTNVVSGNGTGIRITSSGHFIQDNLVGTDVSGTLDRGNTTGIEIDGGADNRIGTTNAGNVVSGNVTGVLLHNGATGNLVENNLIGTDSSGTGPLGNSSSGVRIDGASNNVVGGSVTSPGAPPGNVISANNMGVTIEGSAADNVVSGNLIGPDATGTAALNLFATGIRLSATQGNRIGGPTAAERNVISGNGTGILVTTGASGHTIQGNFIGVDVSGAMALGNNLIGVEINSASAMTLGGTAATFGEPPGNVISANGSHGVLLNGNPVGGPAATVVQGNLIGLARTSSGTLVDAGNGGDGVRITFSNGNVLGGASTGQGNAFSGNDGAGVSLRLSSDSLIEGNCIGSSADCNTTSPTPFANSGEGLRFELGASGSDVLGNTIAFNDAVGVAVTSSAAGNSIRQNRIFQNDDLGTGLGIDLGAIGVTPNDACDTDTGSNGLQNFPILTVVSPGPFDTTIQGALESTPNRAFEVDIYNSPSCNAGAPDDHGEGRNLLGTIQVMTDSTCSTGTFTFFAPTGLTGVITATATDTVTGDTSEFSQCFPVP